MMLLNKSKELITLERKFFYFISSLFLFFVFFPYIKVFPISTDTQPGALCMAALIFVLVKNRKLPKPILLLLFPLCLAVSLSLFSGFGMLSIQCILNYIALFLVSASTYFVLRIRGGLGQKWLNIVIGIWFFVGFVQTFLYKNFAVFLLSRASNGSMSRGVIGLAPEPAHYASFCVLLLVLSCFHNSDKKLPLVLLLIAILFFSKSTLMVLILAILGLYYVLCGFSFRRLIAVGIAGYLGYALLVSPLFGGTRVQALFIKIPILIENPWVFLLSDASLLDRYLHLFLSIKGFFSCWGVPHGFHLWGDYVVQYLQFYGISARIGLGRIMSGYGAALFELGFFGLFIPVSLGYSLKKYFKVQSTYFYFSLLSLTTFMFTPISIGFPMFGFLIGYLCYYSKPSLPQQTRLEIE